MAYSVAADITARLRGLVTHIQDEPVVRGSTAGGSDTVAHPIKGNTAINATARGAQAYDSPTYALTTDYTISGSQISWAPAGSEPAAAATYYLSYDHYANDSGATGITDAIDRADSLINASCAVNYSLPFASAPSLLKELSRTLAAYYIALDVWGEQGVPETLAKRVETIMSDKGELAMIRSGELKLVTDTGTVIAQNVTMGSSMSDYQPIFDEGDAENWVIDPDMVTDLADAKA